MCVLWGVCVCVMMLLMFVLRARAVNVFYYLVFLWGLKCVVVKVLGFVNDLLIVRRSLCVWEVLIEWCVWVGIVCVGVCRVSARDVNAGIIARWIELYVCGVDDDVMLSEIVIDGVIKV